MKALTKSELMEIANLVVKGDTVALRKIIDDAKNNVPGVGTLQAWVAGVAMKGISKGDMGALDVLLNRLIGKVKDEVNFTGDVPNNAPQVIVTIPSNGREAK